MCLETYKSKSGIKISFVFHHEDEGIIKLFKNDSHNWYNFPAMMNLILRVKHEFFNTSSSHYQIDFSI